MKQYLDLLEHIIANGSIKNDRTGVGTKSVFGYQSRFDLTKGFPCLTTKKLNIKAIIIELLWFLKGDTNIKFLQDNGVKIWNEWADENGDLGDIYGKQWRSWKSSNGETVDQISNLIDLIKNDPDSRRMVVNSWNVGYLNKMALPPCHCLFQFYVVNNKLSCQLYQRSADVFLGVPFNIASYSLLTMMIAQVLDLELGEFIHTLGDAHLYINHLDLAKEQITRKVKKLPTIKINKDVKSIFEFKYEDFEIIDYDAHPHIYAPIAV